MNMLLGEMIFGGLGIGIYSILMVALLGLFLNGLMIGRMPEYLGKRYAVGPLWTGDTCAGFCRSVRAADQQANDPGQAQIGTALIVVALTYLPFLALGPIIEHPLL